MKKLHKQSYGCHLRAVKVSVSQTDKSVAATSQNDTRRPDKDGPSLLFPGLARSDLEQISDFQPIQMETGCLFCKVNSHNFGKSD